MTEGGLLHETRANRDLFATVLLNEIDNIVQPLRTLEEPIRAAIIALVGAAQLVTSYERSLNQPNDGIGKDFDRILGDIHPEGARLLTGLRTVGLAEAVAYAWTMAGTRGAAMRDREGDQMAARAAAAEVSCALSQLDALTEVFRQLRLPRRS